VTLTDGDTGDTLRTWQVKGEPWELAVAETKEEGELAAGAAGGGGGGGGGGSSSSSSSVSVLIVGPGAVVNA